MPRRRGEDSDEESDSDDLEDDDDTDWAPEDSKHKAKACTAAQVKRASKRQATSSKRASEDSTDDDLDSEYEKLRRANMKCWRGQRRERCATKLIQLLCSVTRADRSLSARPCPINQPFIVLTETKFSYRYIPVWARYSPHRTRVEAHANMLSPRFVDGKW